MAARRTTPPPKSERPKHTAQEKLGDISALERRIKELEEFDPATITKRFSDSNVEVLETAIDETLADVFGKDTDDYQRYSGAAHLDNGPVSMVIEGWGHHNDAAEAQKYVAEGKERSIALLKQAVRRLKEEIDREQSTSAIVTLAASASIHPAPSPARSRKIFIVHGHDPGMREAVARLVEQLGFEAVILHEQPNQGRTVIEKFETHGETAGFAIALLSADDEGRAKSGGDLAPRARQNVVLELGYFVGKLGRNNVCALKRGDIELPSDIVGVVYEPFDDAGAWKQVIARELQAAGYEVNWNVVMRR